MDVVVEVLLQTDCILESRLSGMASLKGSIPFGQFLAIPFILIRMFTLPWAPNAYATSAKQKVLAFVFAVRCAI